MNFFPLSILFFTFSLITTALHSEIHIFPDMKQHKQKCLDEIARDPIKGKNPSYPFARVRKTVYADDADLIPKVSDAGKVFHENNTSYQVMHNGVKVLAGGYYGGWMTDIIHALRGHHEPQEEKAFHEVLKYIPQKATMIELGSYWGYYSLWFSKSIPYATNWLIEPDPSYMQLGKTNFSLNNLNANFVLGFVQMYPTDPQLFPKAKRILIDAFLKENRIPHVNILHSDIQGAEYEMLLSAKEALTQQKIDYLFISTHSPGIHDQCKKIIQQHGYVIIAEHDMAESCSVDGLIVAKRKNIVGPSYIPVKKYL